MTIRERKGREGEEGEAVTKQNTTSLALILMPVPIESMPAHKHQNIHLSVHLHLYPIGQLSFLVWSNSKTREAQSYLTPSTGGHGWCWRNLCCHCC